jgi:hypothetical protein
MPAWFPLLNSLAAAPTPDARRVVGEMSALLLLLALVGVVVLCALSLLYLRRRARLRAEIAASRGRKAELADAWSESSKRMPLEDDGSIPREPGTG